MKAVLAALATAAVLVGLAWAGNVTPTQVTALSKRVAKLEQTTRQLDRAHSDLIAYINKCLLTWYAVREEEGYVWRDASGAEGLRPALALADVNDKKSIHVITSPAACFDRRLP